MAKDATTTASSKKHDKPIGCRLTHKSQQVFEQFCRDDRRKPADAVEFLVEVGLAVWQQNQLDNFRIQPVDNA